MDKNADDTLVLRDLVPAEPLLPDPALPAWAWIAIALVALGLVGLVIVLARKQRKSPAENARAAVEEAYRQACSELNSTPSGSIQEIATRVSVILRRYLATAAKDPALFETHEEFIARHAALSGYPEDLRATTAEGFSHLARLKYGRDATGSPDVLLTGARQLLDRLHQHQPA
ncbi:DUF4381 family protein [Luteolibacter marinus]|uniref:DUF4381 family protein n=1 Tax=Luteolibacter marinus TaxID=2776705 RepID=UPI0018661712|nr:DUF4381 family protein [Luteolibacter marinus]